jgi:hypothetical protein
MARRERPGAKVVSNEERREQARTAREAALARFKDTTAKMATRAREQQQLLNAYPVRDPDKLKQGLDALILRQPDVPEELHVSTAYRALAGITARTLNEHGTQVVLCWPNCDPSPAAIGSLIALADCASANPIKVDNYDALAAPTSFRALIYPYARTAHRLLRHLYVDKDFLGRLQIRHQTRNQTNKDDPALADYHRILARVQSLTGKDKTGTRYEELRHPCLDEITPSGSCTNKSARSELLWRIGSKTDIRQLRRAGLADDPERAPFYLFGLRADENVEAALKRFPGGLDIVFLDLDYAGRNRLGRDWLPRIRNFIALAQAKFTPLAVVALTDDPWAFDALRFDAFGPKRQGKEKRPPTPSSVVHFQGSAIAVSHDAPLPIYSTVESWETLGFSGASEETFARLRAASRKSLELNDRQCAETLRELAGRLRRCVSLPGSLTQLGQFCAEDSGELRAADLMSAYRVEPLLRDLRSSTDPFAQLQGAELRSLCDEVSRISANTAQLSPMALLLRDFVKKRLRLSSRTALLFPNDMLADFAVHTLSRDEEIGDEVKERIKKRMLVFTYKSEFSDLEALAIPRRKEFKRLVVVAPSRSSMLSLASREWLPENVIVLADCDTLRSVAQDTSRLAGLPELGPLSKRMSGLAEQARKKVEEITHTSVQLGGAEEPEEDLEFPLGGVVDLAGNVKPGQSYIEFELDGGQTLLARPGTKLVIQDRNRTIPAFVEMDASQVDVDERLCVIGDAFLEMARPLLNITVRAAEEIRDYHQLVVDRFAKLSGRNDSERLAALVASMALPSVNTQRASYWIDLQGQMDAPLHDVVPHAPREYATFLAFMKALSVTETLALRYWTWAVIAQRSSRQRAAMSFHDAYRSILVDSYAAQSDNPSRAQEVRQLRAAAENYVSVVRSKKEQRGELARS